MTQIIMRRSFGPFYDREMRDKEERPGIASSLPPLRGASLADALTLRCWLQTLGWLISLVEGTPSVMFCYGSHSE